MSIDVRIIKGSNLFDWAVNAAVDVIMRTQQAAARGTPVRIALGAKYTAGLVYHVLANDRRQQLPWASIRWFFVSDGRDIIDNDIDSESNGKGVAPDAYYFADYFLFSETELDSHNIFPIPATGTAPFRQQDDTRRYCGRSSVSPKVKYPASTL